MSASILENPGPQLIPDIAVQQLSSNDAFPFADPEVSAGVRPTDDGRTWCGCTAPNAADWRVNVCKTHARTHERRTNKRLLFFFLDRSPALTSRCSRTHVDRGFPAVLVRKNNKAIPDVDCPCRDERRLNGLGH